MHLWNKFYKKQQFINFDPKISDSFIYPWSLSSFSPAFSVLVHFLFIQQILEILNFRKERVALTHSFGGSTPWSVVSGWVVRQQHIVATMYNKAGLVTLGLRSNTRRWSPWSLPPFPFWAWPPTNLKTPQWALLLKVSTISDSVNTEEFILLYKPTQIMKAFFSKAKLCSTV